jgi:hypothetical protein
VSQTSRNPFAEIRLLEQRLGCATLDDLRTYTRVAAEDLIALERQGRIKWDGEAWSTVAA